MGESLRIPLSASSIPAWLACIGVLATAWWYAEDLQRNVQGIARDLAEDRRREAELNDRWMLDDDRDFEHLGGQIAALQTDIATGRDDLNYRMGLHVGDHETMNRTIQEVCRRWQSYESEARD